MVKTIAKQSGLWILKGVSLRERYIAIYEPTKTGSRSRFQCFGKFKSRSLIDLSFHTYVGCMFEICSISKFVAHLHDNFYELNHTNKPWMELSHLTSYQMKHTFDKAFFPQGVQNIQSVPYNSQATAWLELLLACFFNFGMISRSHTHPASYPPHSQLIKWFSTTGSSTRGP